ncbi:MAG: FAD-dependent oxidoreductase [Myxococcota bacterium]|nr:FAD-dependent oxidoreductase [Myxococcota bacterium]
MGRRVGERKRVVILGGGFAGLAAALELSSDRHDVTLIDRRAAFEFLPNIHELLSRVKTPELLRLPLDRTLRRAGHRFVRDTVTAVDPAAHTVSTRRDTTFHYDALIVGLGGVDATRGVHGVREHAFPFKSVRECDRIGRELDRLAARPEPARVVIVGGGLEGVEALGETLRRHRRSDIHVSLVEARERLLAETPAALDAHVRELCAPYAVELLMESPVKRIEREAVVLADDRSLPSDLTIWTGGPGPPDLLAEWGLAPAGSWAPVDTTLQSKDHPDVFVAGDAAELPTPLSKQGYHALDMGVRAARNAARLLAGRELRPFRPSGKPMLVSFGDLSCFLVAGRRVLAGPSLGAAKEAVFELVMTQLDAGPWWSRIPRALRRVDRATRSLLWPTLSSFEALRRQGRVTLLAD